MSLKAHGLVAAWPSMPARLWGVAYVLAEYHESGDDQCTPSLQQLANRLETSPRTIMRALAELESRGLISRYRRRRGHGSLSNVYVLHAAPKKDSDKNVVSMENRISTSQRRQRHV